MEKLVRCARGGHWCASADNYGVDRNKWVVLKPIPIDLDPDETTAMDTSANA